MLKKTFIISTFLSMFLSFANAQDNLKTFQPMSSSDAEAIKSLKDPKNVSNTELVMAVSKIVEDMKITDINKKIDFVNSLKVTADIKEQVISQIKNNLSYSDYEKVDDGMFRVKNNKCHNNSSVKNELPHHRRAGHGCFAHPFFTCRY